MNIGRVIENILHQMNSANGMDFDKYQKLTQVFGYGSGTKYSAFLAYVTALWASDNLTLGEYKALVEAAEE